MTSVLVVSSDHVGSSMAGPGIRYLWFARELARRGYDVTLVVPFPTDLAEPGFETVVDNPWHAGRMTRLARSRDAVVAQRLPVPTMLALARSATRAVYDLYAPLTIEHAALARHSRGRSPAAGLDQLTLRVALESGDAFACASERQRDLWLGGLAALGRIEPDAYARDPSFRSLVAVVPVGIDPEPPVARGPVLKGVVPGIGAGDTVALWGGGIWDWLDPLTVIRAVHRLDRPELRLFVIGTRSPNAAVPPMAMETRALDLAGELGVLGSSVIVNEGWVPVAERGAFLLEADVGVSAHGDELEARFAVRARLLDCIWAGLPIVTSRGDALAEVVEERGLGRAVAPGDVDAYAEALADVLDRDRASFAPSFAAARPGFEWPEAIAPLAALLEGAPTLARPPARTLPLAEYAFLRSRLALAVHGPGGMAQRGATGALRRLAGDRAAHPPGARPEAAAGKEPPTQPLP